MTVPLRSLGQPDFARPLELMMDCHRRIERFLGVLERVVEQYRDRPLDGEATEALETALNYFVTAAPLHTADEEQSLFPRLHESGDPAAREAMLQIDQLETDHQKALGAHARLEEIGRQWIRSGQLDRADRDEFAAILAEMSAMYSEHIRIEDESVFVLADRVLDTATLLDVGEEMRQRRRDAPGRDGSRCAQRRREWLEAGPQ